MIGRTSVSSFYAQEIPRHFRYLHSANSLRLTLGRTFFCSYKEFFTMFPYLIRLKIKWRMRLRRLNLIWSEENWKERKSTWLGEEFTIVKKNGRFLEPRKGFCYSKARIESAAHRIVKLSTCLLFVLSSRSIFYRASNQRATTERRNFPPWLCVPVNLPSKPPRTSVNVFSRVPRIHETVPTSMSHRVTNYWRVVPLSAVRNSAWAYAHFRNGLFLL